jgi:hypothetical protein
MKKLIIILFVLFANYCFATHVHWVATAGGAWESGSSWDTGSAPTTSDSAFIDAASFAANGKTITIGAAASCATFDCSGADQTFTLSSSVYTLSVYGSLILSTNLSVSFTSTAYLYLKATTTGWSITSNSNTSSWNRIYFNGVNGGWSNSDAWNCGTSMFFMVNGHWNTNSKTITSTSHIYSAIGAQTLTLGSSIFTVGGWAAAITTFNRNTSTVVLNITTGATLPSNLFYNLTINGASSIVTSGLFYGDCIISNTFTLTGANAQNYRLLVASNTIGTPRTITCNGNIVASNVDFRDIVLAGTASNDLSAITGGSGDCGGNTGTFTTGVPQYYKHTSGNCTWKDATKWFTDLTPRTTAGRVPLPQDNPIFDASSFTGNSTLTVDCSRIGRSLDMSGVDDAVTFTLANAVTTYGGMRPSSNVTVGGNYLITFDGHGRTFTTPIYLGTNHVNNFDVLGSNTFSEMIITSGYKCRFTAGTTQNIGKFTAVGTAIAPITISSATAATHTLNFTGAGKVSCDYLNLSYSIATPSNTWYAGSHSTDSGNNTGWLFRTLPKTINKAFISKWNRSYVSKINGN